MKAKFKVSDLFWGCGITIIAVVLLELLLWGEIDVELLFDSDFVFIYLFMVVVFSAFPWLIRDSKIKKESGISGMANLVGVESLDPGKGLELMKKYKNEVGALDLGRYPHNVALEVLTAANIPITTARELLTGEEELLLNSKLECMLRDPNGYLIARKQEVEQLAKEQSRTSVMKCPKCQSDDIFVMGENKKSFSLKKAVAGTVLTGGIGAIAGFAGKKNGYDCYCGDCKHRFLLKDK